MSKKLTFYLGIVSNLLVSQTDKRQSLLRLA